MKLNELDNKKFAQKALKENYEVSLDVQKLNFNQTKSMLTKVKGLISEAKQTSEYYSQQNTPSYMKLVFLNQALSEHYASLKPAQIVVENEEVEKSQVILATQDMVDTIQKMIENVSDMMVKELPALVSSVESEIGVNESQDFNTQVTEALAALTQSLSDARTSMQGALGVVTGQGGAAFDTEAPADDLGMDADMGAEAPADDLGMDAGEEMPEPELPAEEPEEEPVAGAGREKR